MLAPLGAVIAATSFAWIALAKGQHFECCHSLVFDVLRAWLIAASGRAEVSLTKSHAATSDGAGAAVANQLDTHVLERLHDLR
jgi:hypothetical protein